MSMSEYYFLTRLNKSFEDAVEVTTKALEAQGFGILTQIDVAATMKKKLDADLRPYLILGACNPTFAFKAIQVENKIGTMLPCNVIVREEEDGSVEVAAVDPIASMQAIENPDLGEVALQVRALLEEVIAELS
jgi:uncharacterized protein (DUF302 family)